jgi:two-component system nitrate/nitrite sensor histidine kinase NarX
LARLKAALGVAYRQLRTTLSGLNEPQSGADDFVRVLEADLSRFQRETGIAAQLTGDAASALDLAPLAQSQALHIVRESLANVRRHAQARSVCVSVERVSGEIRIVIRDDGRGFDHETVGAGNHLGLDIMRTRAARSGGELLVQSAPGCGTGVVARFPLAPLEGDLP